MTAGEKIRKRRLELGITQKDVARMIGTTSAYVSAVEKQKRGVNKETRLEKFAEALECSVDDLRSDAPKGMVDPASDDFGSVCNCAVRYCLGRRSYMPSLVCRYIISLLPEFDWMNDNGCCLHHSKIEYWAYMPEPPTED